LRRLAQGIGLRRAYVTFLRTTIHSGKNEVSRAARVGHFLVK
jgi:hypothetical protein